MKTCRTTHQSFQLNRTKTPILIRIALLLYPCVKSSRNLAKFPKASRRARPVGGRSSQLEASRKISDNPSTHWVDPRLELINGFPTVQVTLRIGSPDREPSIDMQAILQRIQHLFHSAFGSTSLLERTKDIQQQANAVAKHRELDHLRHEVGDLLASTLQLCNECGWDPSELVSETLDRIEQRVDVYKKLNRKQRIGLLRADFDRCFSF